MEPLLAPMAFEPDDAGAFPYGYKTYDIGDAEDTHHQADAADDGAYDVHSGEETGMAFAERFHAVQEKLSSCVGLSRRICRMMPWSSLLNASVETPAFPSR